MQARMTKPPRRRRGNGFVRFVLTVMFIAAAVAAGYWIWLNYIPNTEMKVPDYRYTNPVVYQGELIEGQAIVDGEQIKLPLGMLQEVLADKLPVRYEADSESIIMTTKDKVLHMKTEALTATLNQKPFELAFAAEKQDEQVYVPLTPVQELSGLTADLAEVTGIVTLLMPGQAIQRGQAVLDDVTAIREEPTIRAPIVEKVTGGDGVRIWGEAEGWYRVQGPEGHLGYADKSDIIFTDIEEAEEPKQEEPFVAWKVLGEKINLTWEAVYARQPDTSKIADMPGVNVVSPTWMELVKGDGTIRMKGDKNYVAWAHNRGMQVWGLFANGFDPDLTTEALQSYTTRSSMAKQLLSYAKLYNLQGINIDFENVYTKDKENLVQFVREFTPLAHEQNLVVSIDVTPKSNSEMWSVFLDRAALGQTVDFMMLMAYDEHWGSSPVAGSVASLPWVERSVTRILEEDGVPPRKLLLGLPLYTRVWTETKQKDGTVKVTSKAIGMEAAEELIREKKLKPVFQPETGQNYVEYKEDGALNRIWLEDETSMAARIALVRKYDLGGVASWQRSFQKPAIWPVIEEGLNKRP
ncbi:glycosyl hydrolase [Paenibacillus sambharensis]|uniref:Glycosyl hydrolase n=1 Tax=Paenibacillus sambharensis TaxID=1803190 RepID=A0A2W1LLK1_9BACL|nr:glycosyl hydrolase family 18 protein [Paenibacillus sambharensis]PZD95755.1 glycosyl hydrolase [Paenibacillus sambharensis]